jgi:hypothetical protein
MKTRMYTIPALAGALVFLGVSSLSAGVSGAIFTTNSAGTVVNGNQYDSPCSVYLNGGPGPHAPAHAAGLPDGDYYFQVTDPSGRQLLSTDPVANRHFTVSGGVIVAYVGDGSDPIHLTGPDQNDPGGITIRLANLSCPVDFLATSNNGGAYKVWVTPAANFNGNPALVDNTCGTGCFHGFLPAASKTDNFKVNTASTTFCLTVQKLFLQTDTGIYLPQPGWEFDVTDPLSVVNKFFTDTTGQLVVCDLAPGAYTVAEDPTSNVAGITWNVGVDVTQTIPTAVTINWAIGQPVPGLVFRNQPPPGAILQ